MCASMFMVGSLGPAFGVGFWPSFWIIIAANAMGVAPMAYLGTWGPRTGLAQMELATAAFGRLVRLPALTNWLTTMGWQGLNNVFGIAAIHLLFGTPLWVGVVACFLGGLILPLLGYEAVHQFEKLMTFVMGTMFVVLTWHVLNGAGTTQVPNTLHGPEALGSAILVFMAIMGVAAGWAPYASDYSRYLPAGTDPWRAFGWTFAACTVALSWVQILGLLVASQIIDGGVNGTTHVLWSIMGGQGLWGSLTLAAIFLSTIGMGAVNAYTGSLSLQTAGVRLPRLLIVGVLGLLTACVSLWFLYGGKDLPTRAQSFLLFIGYWIAPWLGIVITDWVKRKGQLSVSALNRRTEMQSGFPAGMAFVLGFLLALPFSNTTIGSDFVAAHPDSPLRFLLGWVSTNLLAGADLGFPVGLLVAVVTYLAADRKTKRPSLASASR
jgi:NCS1 family nucleobase:cation symporter-1